MNPQKYYRNGQASVVLNDVSFKARRQSNGQASVEMLVTLGLILVFTIPVLMLLLVSSQFGAENYSIQQAQASSHMIADSINDVYIQGTGASKIILVNFPGNTEDVYVLNKEVIVRLKLGSGELYDAVSPVFANISDSDVISTKGLLQFNITNDGGTVKLNPNGGELASEVKANG